MAQLFADSPLGRHSEYIDTYTPALLHPIARSLARESLGLSAALPFKGVDVWTAFELSWLDPHGRPQVMMAECQVPCDTPNLIESKSFKLYLNSFANSTFVDADAVRQLLVQDLSAAAGGPVAVELWSLDEALLTLPMSSGGLCVDQLPATLSQYQHDPSLLRCNDGPLQDTTLCSHLLRSRCPVTQQPDWATVQVHYRGAPIDPTSFLAYVVSFRNHIGFHEQVIEQMFLDIQQQCRPQSLSVYGRFTRRGGLDINPFRSSEAHPAPRFRVVRQ